MSNDGLRASRAPAAESTLDFVGRKARNFFELVPAYKVVNYGISALSNAKPKSLDNATLTQSLGNIITGNLDYKRAIESAMRAERVSAREAEKTRRWQEQMSNSAYSRAIADLKRNGINPYAIGSFSPASTPSGATGSAYNVSPHSAANSALGALGLIERAYSNVIKRSAEKNDSEMKLLFTLLKFLI